MKRFLSVVALVSLTACATLDDLGVAGGEDRMSREYVAQQIKIGQSTKSDVLALYGEPGYKSESSDGRDYWSYAEDQINRDYISMARSYLPSFGTVADAAVATQQRKTSRSLDFFFNRAGVVESFGISGNTGAK